MNRTTRYAPLAVVALAAVAMLVHGPIQQPEGYHAFADTRPFLGMPNAADVLSNVGFALAGLWGLWMFRSRAAQRTLGASWPGYALFLAALALTAVGSTFYHLAPDDSRLVWDRLPIALACAGLLAGAFADTHIRPYSVRLAVGLAGFGAATVWWWAATADLRPYLFLQAAPLVLVPLWQARGPTPFAERAAFGFAIILYVAAKIAELGDRAIYEVVGMMSGHTMKHLLAAIASAVIVGSLVMRARGAAHEDADGPVSVSLWDIQGLGGRGGP